jgi:hypothetical protein
MAVLIDSHGRIECGDREDRTLFILYTRHPQPRWAAAQYSKSAVLGAGSLLPRSTPAGHNGDLSRGPKRCA